MEQQRQEEEEGKGKRERDGDVEGEGEDAEGGDRKRRKVDDDEGDDDQEMEMDEDDEDKPGEEEAGCQQAQSLAVRDGLLMMTLRYSRCTETQRAQCTDRTARFESASGDHTGGACQPV